MVTVPKKYITMTVAIASILLLAGSTGCSCDDDDDGYVAPVVGYETKAVAIADVAGAGRGAVVSANRVYGDGQPHPGFVTVRLQDPAHVGAFLAPIETDTACDPAALSLVDLSGKNGRPDLVLVHRLESSDPQGTGTLAIQRQDPASVGHFLAPMALSLGARNPSGLATGDLNHDGLPDVAVAADGANSVQVFFQNADGTFRSQTLDVGGVPSAVAIGDLRHSGFQDLVVATTGNTVAVLLQDEANPGTFLPPTTYTVGIHPTSIQIAALTDGDHPDILTSNFGTDAVPTSQGLSVLPHDPANVGKFLMVETYDTGEYLAASVAVGDGLAPGQTTGTPFVAVACEGMLGYSGVIAVFHSDAQNPGKLLAPDHYAGVYGPCGVAVGDLGGNAMVTADGGTYLRYEIPGHPGSFGELIRLIQ